MDFERNKKKNCFHYTTIPIKNIVGIFDIYIFDWYFWYSYLYNYTNQKYPYQKKPIKNMFFFLVLKQKKSFVDILNSLMDGKKFLWLNDLCKIYVSEVPLISY